MQPHFHRLFFILLLISGFLFPGYGNTAPQPAEPPRPENNQAKSTGGESTVPQQPASYNDFSNFNLSTPQHAVISFVELYNGIIPASKTNDLREICTKSATTSYQKDCLALLENRLHYLKSIAVTLKGAYFSYQPPSQLNANPMQLKASWREKLSFFDGSTKLNNKSMVLSLQKSDNDWKVNFVSE